MIIKVYLIDHYDSFTANLVDWLSASSLAETIEVLPFDNHAALESITHHPVPLIFSPGPKSPADVPSSVQLLASVLGKVPILGVCLGFQILGGLAGASLGPAVRPTHGNLQKVYPSSKCFLAKRPPFSAAFYNSLELRVPAKLKTGWNVSAWGESKQPVVIEYMPHHPCGAIGVQFHPESFLTREQDAAWLRDYFWQRVGQFFSSRPMRPACGKARCHLPKSHQLRYNLST